VAVMSDECGVPLDLVGGVYWFVYLWPPSKD
jgi:hypothetical protein